MMPTHESLALLTTYRTVAARLGFSVDEFSRLDLSQMNFSEVYAEFTEAARLPDELETAIQIQQKIEDFYARSGR